MKLFDLHIRIEHGYVDLHVPSKQRELLYLCLDWDVHKLVVAIGQEIRDHWLKVRLPGIHFRKTEPVSLRIVRIRDVE